MNPIRVSLLCASLLACVACATTQGQGAATPTAAGSRPTELADWPALRSGIARDPAIEARVAEILASMTLAQKVGQMTQAEIKSITPDEVREYYIGSVLNGGGSWPDKSKHTSVADWLSLSDRYHDASMATNAKIPVPVIWGTDAMHGHSNIYGATLFPHNVGLGAAHDVALIEQIAAATARGVRATGIQWVFAPAVAVVKDTRWGRSYESFSSDAALVRDYSVAYVRGAQDRFREDGNVVATAKHFLGDGATENGKDQGLARITRAEMLNEHAQGYYGAIEAGVQVVMASYNSWTDADTGEEHGKMHGARDLLTGALKDKMGFDGFVVGDWNGHGQLPGCTNASCAPAINAGVDMIMVPDDWKAFIANTIRQVEAGEIPQARIDDAVTRILRVKLRSGLFGSRPSANRFAGDVEALQHRDLARRAVRESLVLLKNEGGVLPLRRDQRVLVVGKGADSVPLQAGGWSLTWQGTDTTNADFPHADTILSGVREAVGEANVVFSADGSAAAQGGFDLVLAVVGETPYAEYNGDIAVADTVTHSRQYPEDLAVLQRVASAGKPVVTVFLSGRPRYTNDLMNLSQVFVAAWLPGSEGKGVADVLFAKRGNGVAHEFRGALGFPWPAVACPNAQTAPLFAVGYGLRHGSDARLGILPVDTTAACAEASVLPVFKMADIPPFTLHVAAGDASRAVGADLNRSFEFPTANPALRVQTVQVNTQQDAKQVTWLAPGRFYAANPARNNLIAMARADAAVQFDVVVHQRPKAPVLLSMGCGTGCGADVDLAGTLSAYTVGSKHTVKVPLACFADRGLNLGGVEVPFSISATAPFSAAFTDIKVVAGAAKHTDAVACPAAPATP